jgi:flagellar basal-body rod protein FlgB
MVLDRLFNQGPMPVLEQTLQFTDARQRVIAENIADVDTPGYQTKDLSVDAFQAMLRDKVSQQNTASPGSVRFDDIQEEVENPTSGILSHDGNNRSAEQLMSDEAKNALMHNLAVELLRQQYQTMQMALKERVS